MQLQPDSKTILLEKEDVRILCRPGAGAGTCIWLAAGAEGMECLFYRKSEGRDLNGKTLEERWKAGQTVAKRDGCSRAKKFKGG